jgi:NAD(P)H-dependent flavin oxidoreductase YrpB (nitropropane dioxygenase family)
MRENVRLALSQRALDAGSPLAEQHGTRYPVVQGPMTRVSDTAAFADAVASNGGLPMIALAMLRKHEVERILEETKSRLGDRSWGIGLLGFIPEQLRAEQLEVVRQVRPAFAVIAGGRPSQAAELEA